MNPDQLVQTQQEVPTSCEGEGLVPRGGGTGRRRGDERHLNVGEAHLRGAFTLKSRVFQTALKRKVVLDDD